MQDTSIQAFTNEVFPTLASRQHKVLELFQHNAAFTNSEIGKALGWPINQVTGRTNELVKMRLLEKGGKRTCDVTGRTVNTWRAAKGQPKPVVPEDLPTHYQFPSRRDYKETYKVSERDGKVFCTCKGFHYRGTCVHAKKIQTFVDQKKVTQSIF